MDACSSQDPAIKKLLLYSISSIQRREADVELRRRSLVAVGAQLSVSTLLDRAR